MAKIPGSNPGRPTSALFLLGKEKVQVAQKENQEAALPKEVSGSSIKAINPSGGVLKSKGKRYKSEPPKKRHNNRPKAKKKHHKKIWSVGLDRSLPDEEIQRFFNIIKNPKHKLCFQLMYYLGLRISEGVNVNIQDFNLELGWFRVYAPKTQQMDALPLKANPIVPILKEYIHQFKQEIKIMMDISSTGMVDISARITCETSSRCTAREQA